MACKKAGMKSLLPHPTLRAPQTRLDDPDVPLTNGTPGGFPKGMSMSHSNPATTGPSLIGVPGVPGPPLLSWPLQALQVLEPRLHLVTVGFFYNEVNNISKADIPKMSCSTSVRLVTNTRACSFQNSPTPHGYEKKKSPPSTPLTD